MAAMAATRHSLQCELFRPNDERLVDVVNVVEATKRKKMSLLCAVVTTEKPVRVALYQVKSTDKDLYKKKHCWSLRDLRLVDGRKADSAEFDLHFDKVYRWQAKNIPGAQRLSALPIPLLLEKVVADEADDYQALTAREEADLECLMAKYEFAIHNAEEFTEQLARELAALDASNVHTIMESGAAGPEAHGNDADGT
ncbi:hypothetical protein MTO96_002453 [Rhipicephalus appendiculatus]